VEYERRNANDPEILKTFPGLGNPHNDYLLIGVQLGWVGIALFVAALGALYRLAGQLPVERAWLARGTLVAYASGALVNSFLWDAAEGTIFVLLIGTLFAGPWPPARAADPPLR
jgi:O-antigen ligase